MKIESLTLRGFRNYENLSLEFDPGVNLILGDNAQGKTNLLEAISYLGSGRSFRAQKNAELIRFGSAFGEVEGRVFSQEREQTLRFLIFPGSRPRQIFRNGAKKKTLSEIAGVLPTVLFCPEDLMILKLGAGQRRRFGDSGLCQLRPNYDAALTEYHRILEQKSRILKDYHENPGLLEILPEYNARLCQVGALLISYRARYYDALGKAAAVYHNQFSGGAEEFRLEYKTVSTVIDPFAPVGKLTEALLSHLESHRRAELDSGQCLTGPHKDDFEILLSVLFSSCDYSCACRNSQRNRKNNSANVDYFNVIMRIPYYLDSDYRKIIWRYEMDFCILSVILVCRGSCHGALYMERKLEARENEWE